MYELIGLLIECLNERETSNSVTNKVKAEGGQLGGRSTMEPNCRELPEPKVGRLLPQTLTSRSIITFICFL